MHFGPLNTMRATEMRNSTKKVLTSPEVFADLVFWRCLHALIMNEQATNTKKFPERCGVFNGVFVPRTLLNVHDCIIFNENMYNQPY